ncbi:MAG: GNAT family N-acetyltransferase [Clostridia bacterium]|nr:GNAT family N-acetyltransferase [Clostridia bacterium]
MTICRHIKKDEAEKAAFIEAECFPVAEACTEKMMTERVMAAPELFLVAEDTETGEIEGFLCGLSTREERFRDEFFSDATLHDPEGENVMLLGLDVLPAYRMRGIARVLMETYKAERLAEGKKRLILTCSEKKVPMYEKMGFHREGTSASLWGGVSWVEMAYDLKN